MRVWGLLHLVRTDCRQNMYVSMNHMAFVYYYKQTSFDMMPVPIGGHMILHAYLHSVPLPEVTLTYCRHCHSTAS